MTELPDDGFELLAQPPRRTRGKLLASVAAVVVLGAGGAATYVAFAAGSSGASSPQEAVQRVVADLENSDLIGVLDDLAPNERDALSSPIRDGVASLKRLGVLSAKADPSKVSGLTFAAHDLTYASNTVRINDHVEIVQITGGTVDLGSDAAKLPFTAKFLDLAKSSPATESRHIAIKHVVRIAAEKVGDGWYASLFYTAADSMAAQAIPTAADAVPATGADSATGAVTSMVKALVSGDVTGALALISPAELPAVHEYGAMIAEHAGRTRDLPVTIKTLDLHSTTLTDGARVTVKKVVLAMGSDEVSIAIDNDCVRLDFGPLHKNVCATDAADLISGLLGSFACGSSFSVNGGAIGGQGPVNGGQGPVNGGAFHRGGIVAGGCSALNFSSTQKRAIGDVLSGLLSVGVIATQVGGKWFVAPVRTVADEGNVFLSHLKDDDLFQLATLGH